MSASNNGTDIAHNAQIAVDSKNHLVVAVDVVSTSADQNQLYNMASKAVEELGLKEEDKTGKNNEKNDTDNNIKDNTPNEKEKEILNGIGR